MQFNHYLVFIIFNFIHITFAQTDDSSNVDYDKGTTGSSGTHMTNAMSLRDKKKPDYYQYRHVVAEGVQKALDECRQKFKWERWNCPKKAFHDILGRDSLPANKELGLTRAFIASGIVLSLFRSCSYGTGSFCGCSQPSAVPTKQEYAPEHSTSRIHHAIQETSLTQRSTVTEPVELNNPIDNGPSTDLITNEPASQSSKFSWAGCEETVKSGFKVAKMYLDSQDALQDGASKLINSHNYEAGRQAVRKNMKMKCKCHGTSGACQVETCWPVLPDLSEVGDYLKRQYKVAAKVGAMTAEDTNIESLKKELAAISSNKLVFSDPSPDYCYENTHLGINGTLGRHCSRSKNRSDGSEVSRSERDSCDRLCTKCGYKIKRETMNLEKQCDCRFVYCCSVECKKCPYTEETFKCVRHS